MLPLESFLLVPAAPIAIVFLIALLFSDRTTHKFQTLWMIATAISALACLIFFISVIQIPLHSQQSHRPANPGGFSAGMGSLAIAYFLGACVALPSFPVLFLLGLMPPKTYNRSFRLTIALATSLAVVSLVAMMFSKNRAYLNDYEQHKKAGQQRIF